MNDARAAGAATPQVWVNFCVVQAIRLAFLRGLLP